MCIRDSPSLYNRRRCRCGRAAQLVVESVYEDLQVKKDLFNAMGEIYKQRAIPADQESTHPIEIRLFGKRPSRREWDWVGGVLLVSSEGGLHEE
eukprot:2933002-Pleurochrysis_carterae.AAC.1